MAALVEPCRPLVDRHLAAPDLAAPDLAVLGRGGPRRRPLEVF